MPTARQAPTIPKMSSDWATARHSSSGWPKFLEAVYLDGIRGWHDQWIEFRFPVVAISGENGSGKSTVLKAAAAAYGADVQGTALVPIVFSPEDFFPTTPWETVSGVWLEYRVRQGDQVSNHSVRKVTARWRGMPDRPRRVTYFLDISRTQPIDTLIGYGRLARTELAATADSLVLDDKYRGILSRVLGRGYENGSLVRDARGKQVGIVSVAGRSYSNFHQGAGEDATTDLVALLQEAPRHCLVLIDEVEASLHPRAQRRLMTELIGVATDRRLQLIVSTHSPYVLEQLPPEARIHLQASRNGEREVVYGASAEYALALMDDEGHPEMTVYCEDTASEYVIDTLVNIEQPLERRRIRIVTVGPASTVRTLGGLVNEARLPDKAIAVLDGDQPAAPGCLRLPGNESPERTAFASLTVLTWRNVATRLAVRTGDLLDAAEDAQLLDEPHTWAARIAARLNPGIRPSKVWEAVVDVWARDVLDADQRKLFVTQLLAELPPVSTSGA